MNQRKIIVYNIPGQTAIDIVDGNRCYFGGDEILMNDEFMFNFHIRPGRTLHRIESVQEFSLKEFSMNGKIFLMIDSSLSIQPKPEKLIIELLILSKNPKIRMASLAGAMTIKQVVVASSAPAWKARQWKKECESLLIPCHVVTEKGAFLMNLKE